MSPIRALQSPEPQRLRQVEIERRILPMRAAVGVVLWVLLGFLALTYPPADVLPTALLATGCVGVLVLCHLRVQRSPAPLAWSALEELAVLAVLSFALTWSGGLHSAVLPLMLMNAIMMGTRFPVRWLVPLVAIAVAVVGAAMVIADPGHVREAPLQTVAWLAAFVLAAGLSAMVARAERRARKDAVHDALTGVLNRLALDARLDEMRARPSRRAETLSVIVLDLDGFKAVNDDAGHHAGDAVLRSVADAVRGSIRVGDLLYRLGGDEFLVVLPGTPTSEAAALAERLRSEIAGARPGGRDITLSLGVAGVVHAHVDLEHLIGRADAALYAAKADGRDRVGLAEPELLARA